MRKGPPPAALALVAKKKVSLCQCCKKEINPREDIEGICGICAAGECLACVDERAKSFESDDDENFFPEIDREEPSEDF